MLDRLIDLFVQSLQLFQFWAIVTDFERGVVLRFGVFHRELGPGFHWLIPFAVEDLLVDNVVPRTMNLGAQSLTTKDGAQIGLGIIITARINDVRKAILEVEHLDDAVRDSCYAEVAHVVHSHTWDELQSDDVDDELLKACRKRARSYGVEVMRVQLSDLAKTRTYRLMQG